MFVKTSLAIWCLLAVLAVSGGCATPYKSAAAGSGYSDFRVSTDVFAVSFRGNTSTLEETVDKYLLRRASELTLEHGFTHFVILSEKERTRSSSVGYSGFKIPFVAPGTAVWIQCFKDPPPDRGLLINAADFLRFNFPEALEKPDSTEADDAGATASPSPRNGR